MFKDTGTKNTIKELKLIEFKKKQIQSAVTIIRLIISTNPSEKAVCFLNISVLLFFWSKKKVLRPKDNTVENKKIKGISNKNSDNSLLTSLIPKNQNKINEKDFVNSSFTNKRNLSDCEFKNLTSILFINKKFNVFRKKEKCEYWEKIHLKYNYSKRR